MTQPSGSGPGDLDTIRQILFGAEASRLDRELAKLAAVVSRWDSQAEKSVAAGEGRS